MFMGGGSVVEKRKCLDLAYPLCFWYIAVTMCMYLCDIYITLIYLISNSTFLVNMNH